MTDSIEVSRSVEILTVGTFTVRVRSRYGLVYWLIGDKVLELRTPAAHKTGFALVKHASEATANELVVVKINGEKIQFPPSNAKQVGAALLRKADDADDFQQQRIH